MVVGFNIDAIQERGIQGAISAFIAQVTHALARHFVGLPLAVGAEVHELESILNDGTTLINRIRCVALQSFIVNVIRHELESRLVVRVGDEVACLRNSDIVEIVRRAPVATYNRGVAVNFLISLNVVN